MSFQTNAVIPTAKVYTSGGPYNKASRSVDRILGNMRLTSSFGDIRSTLSCIGYAFGHSMCRWG